MKAQGYGVKDNVLFQDNKSSILLENNGKASSSKRTKHINVRYFFITDLVKKKEVSVVWCPTGDMIGDFATKPLQGALFRKSRDQIMGVTPARDPGPGKTDRNVGKIKTSKNKPNKGKSIRLVPPGKKAAPQECVGSRTRDRSKGEPGLVEKGRLKSHPSFTSLLQNNLFTETFFHFYKNTRNNIIEITEWNPHSNSGGGFRYRFLLSLTLAFGQRERGVPTEETVEE
jgi:hypothetical protein